MKIAAITKFKHGELFALLRKHGWSQKELARRCGFKHQSQIGNALNLMHRPSEDTINRIQKAFADVGEFVNIAAMFPDAYVGTRQRLVAVQFADVAPAQLQQYAQHERFLLEDAQMPVPENLLDSEAALEALDEVLNAEERDVLRARFVDGLNLQDIAEKFHRSPEGIRRKIKRGLRKIADRLEPTIPASRASVVHVFEHPDGIWRTIKPPPREKRWR